jgi:hypothetical protein
VTVAAIETELADVELVAVRYRLNGTVAHVCVPRRKVVPDAGDHEHRAESARDGRQDREFVPPGWENLGQRLGLRRGAGRHLPRPRVHNGTVMPHPRVPKEFGRNRKPVDRGRILSTNWDRVKRATDGPPSHSDIETRRHRESFSKDPSCPSCPRGVLFTAGWPADSPTSASRSRSS